ncbi:MULTISPECIES: TrbI/VirB10 family protein [unclassified Bradyrhizobium]|uniref:TrbI/VirB10 family protein n=1 Tax=unclassified Bradyrhizobium TaxID=2631580 RepID=UPI0003776E33|nr:MULTISPECIES: TrbI/VirB10 family protein [unclassified Bradyrhizobium]MCK1357168.1 TrbI/VirB10 family protein [Bradyrhizobium sp. CW7]MCK1413204.1 TrbI/VirB10 family protein [Bradyrhizobium sp. CW4]MCK1425780.1 TrbI/VirB10 family protein [Bradyrhizobium sp. 87]MCK1710578.1 TrbI/VirB10 family protein [Bradyrhizobium sp. 143]UPJ26833.1 TrbI/VirB10 family protein [Bradyrhizobium sp. CW1]
MAIGGEDERQNDIPPVAPPDLRLRGEWPPVTRLSRKMLIGLGAVSALAIAGALGYALQTRNKQQAGQELLSTQNRPSPEGLAALPKDYTGLPRQAPPLGPPLPGDLGKPILNAGAAPNTVVPGTAPDPEAQHRSQEVEAARVSRLFAQTNQQPHSVGQLIPNSSTATATTPAATPPVDAGSAQNMQDRKTAFLNGSTDKRTVSPDRLEAKVSPYVVQAGTVIPAALNTGIRSDLPGQITAQVTEAVYDSPSGRYLLIPQGAKLIGQYDSSVAFGQSRILLVWTRIIMPEGTSIVLERQPGADTGGYAGLEDEVDNHWGMLFKAAVLSTMLSVGAEAGTSQNENNLVQAIRSGASNSISQTGQQIVQRQLNIQPTLTIRPGFPVRVIVTRDLVLAPYGQKGAR